MTSKHLLLSSIAALTLLLCGGCDIIPQDERMIPMEKTPHERVVLLEDYTGQKCINCPKAAQEIEKLQEIYGQKLVVVAIHAGVFALPRMVSKAGETYNNFFNISSYPKGMVNRKKTKGKQTIDYPQWGNAIRDAIWQKSGISIDLAHQISPIDSLLTYQATITHSTTQASPQASPQHLSLQVWLIENNIKAIQLMPDGSKNRAYIHQHVLRDALNGLWGKKLTFDKTKANQKGVYDLKNKTWQHQHAYIVCFVYDNKTHEILETIQKPLIIQQEK